VHHTDAEREVGLRPRLAHRRPDLRTIGQSSTEAACREQQPWINGRGHERTRPSSSWWRPWYDVAPRGLDAPSLYFAWCTDASGRIYSLGGGPGPNATPGDPNLAYVERYVGSADLWEPVSPLPIPVADAAACLDGLGSILVLGGYDELGGSRLATVQRYEIATDTWSLGAIDDMPVALTGHAALLGADGRVYVLGGATGPVGSDSITRTCYILDPTTGAWSVGPSMAEARTWFGAVLGDDDHIYALGGVTAGGGTIGVERLYTTPCPVFTMQPQSVEPWQGQAFALPTAVTGGGVIQYQWLRDGVEIADGPTPWGSVITGADTDALRIDNPQAGDDGEYVLEAANDCGATLSDIAVVQIRTPPDLPSNWTVVSLHPQWALTSTANAVRDGRQAGAASTPVDPWDSISRPMLWSGDGDNGVDLTPPGGSPGGEVLALAGDMQVGWWWWNHDCYDGTHWTTCYTGRGAMWQGSSDSHQSLYRPGWEYSTVHDTDGVTHVGTVNTDDDVGNTFSNAVLFPPPSYWPVTLHPDAYDKSGATAIDGGAQYGWVLVSLSYHVGRWEGTPDSFVDLHPAGHATSMIHGAGDGQQVGTVGWNNEREAALWAGSVISFKSLHPPTATVSEARDCADGLQVGSASFTGPRHAVVWAGDADEHVVLHDALGPDFTSSNARGIDVEDDGTIVVVGNAYNASLERTEAVMWIGTTLPPCPGDLDGDRDVDLSDLGILLASFQVDDGGDLNGDGITNLADLGILLAAYDQPCD
jgi:hypothetical protein